MDGLQGMIFHGWAPTDGLRWMGLFGWFSLDGPRRVSLDGWASMGRLRWAGFVGLFRLLGSTRVSARGAKKHLMKASTSSLQVVYQLTALGLLWSKRRAMCIDLPPGK